MDSASFLFPAVDLSVYASNYTGQCVISFYEPDKELRNTPVYIVDTERPFEIDLGAETISEIKCPLVGEVFLVDMGDDGIHRAVCDEKMESILFIDIGYVEMVSENDLRMMTLSKRAQQMTARAIPCKVIDILDEDGYQINDIEGLFNEQISFTIVTIESGKLNVILRTQSKNSNKETLHFTKEELDMLYEEPEMVTTNALKAVGGYAPKDDSEDCPFYDPKTGACFKGNSCRLRHVAPMKDGTTRDRKAVYQLVTDFVPMIGSIVKVCVTCILSCDEFFVHIPEIAARSTSGSLEQLKRKINATDMVNQYKRFVGIPDLQDLVLVWFKKVFYRGKVIDRTDHSCVVFFVDYGFTEDIPAKDIYQWHPRWNMESAQAHRCFLENARRLESKEEEGIEAFHNLVSTGGDISAKIIWCADDLYVRLYDENGFDIGETFCAEGVAELRARVIPASHFIPG